MLQRRYPLNKKTSDDRLSNEAQQFLGRMLPLQSLFFSGRTHGGVRWYSLCPRCQEEYVSSSFVLTPQQDFAFSYSAPVHVPTRSRVHGLFVRSLLGVALNFIIHPIQNFHIDGFHAIIRVIILSKG